MIKELTNEMKICVHRIDVKDTHKRYGLLEGISICCNSMCILCRDCAFDAYCRANFIR